MAGEGGDVTSRQAGFASLFGGAGSVPASLGKGGSVEITQSIKGPPEGVDPNELMKSLTQPLDPKILAAGTTPVPTGHAMSIPPSMQQPLPAFQPTPFMRQGV